ncbi:MAG: SpoIIE family protein phosphatase [Kiritimatiellia bacterium]|nr:SpoIIE family protein phosphatase [Lentisphaerota bacterium]
MIRSFTRIFWIRSLLLALALAAVSGLYCSRRSGREFVNPVAYTVIGEKLYVLERDGNRLLELSCSGKAPPLRLLREERIEPDEADYYYMVRKLYPGPPGQLVTQSYIYDRENSMFRGYRFRIHEPGGVSPPRDLLTVLWTDASNYPEMRYAAGPNGDHYFLNTCADNFNIWVLPSGATAQVTDHPVAPLRELGERNDALAAWNSIQVGADGRIYLACGSSGKIVEYCAEGRRVREFGRVGPDPGSLLAPDNLTFAPEEPGRPPLLTVASTGNRTWVQYDDRGRRVRVLNPRAAGYAHDDIMIGSLFEHPLLGLCAFDLVNRCLVVPGATFRVVQYYSGSRLRNWLHCLGVMLAVVVLWWLLARLRRLVHRLRMPLFVKLSLLFLPVALAGNLMVGYLVRQIMRADKQEESLLRMANLAHVILSTVAPEDLAAIQRPEDRNSAAYERIHAAVSRLVDASQVPHTPKWIFHKIVQDQFFFGINVWRGPIFEPFIITDDRAVFREVLDKRVVRYAVFQDDQGEWLSYITPITDEEGTVRYILELYRPTEAMYRADRAAARRVLWFVGLIGLLMLGLIMIFSFLFTRPIRRLMLATERISTGDFSHRIALRSRDELGKLAEAFNRMVVRLRQYTEDLARAASERERIQTELRFARDMQLGMLPTVFPPYAGVESLEIVGDMEPAREVGGDFFDFFKVDDEHFAVVVADVAGKGVPAGLFLMSVRTLLRSLSRGCPAASAVIAEVNRLLAVDNPSMMFVTMFYLVCNVRTGKVVFCNAGHPPPLHLGAAGARWLETGGHVRNMAVGVREDAAYRDGVIELADGDTLLLYTDGVTEAQDRSQRMFGDQALLELAGAHAAVAPRDLVAEVRAAVFSHQAGCEQFDDVTLLALRFQPPS